MCSTLCPGLLWIECKQVYLYGAREHFRQYYNYMDFSILALYMASYALRFVTQYRLSQADQYFNGTTRVRSAIDSCDTNELMGIVNEIDGSKIHYAYFMKPCRAFSLFVSIFSRTTLLVNYTGHQVLF